MAAMEGLYAACRRVGGRAERKTFYILKDLLWGFVCDARVRDLRVKSERVFNFTFTCKFTVNVKFTCKACVKQTETFTCCYVPLIQWVVSSHFVNRFEPPVKEL